MSIVCGTDFSDTSRTACEAAAAIATRLTSTELWLVHVLDPTTTTTLDSVAQENVRTATQKRVKEEVANIQKRTAARVYAVVLTGPVCDTLLGFAEAKDARLLIVASQGHGASPIYRASGVSERLAESAQLPILVVRDPAPLEAWAKGERPLRVLLGVDWTRSCDAAIRWVKMLRACGTCDVVVGNVYYSDLGDQGALRYGLPQHYSWLERAPAAEPLIARDLAARVGDLGGQGEVVFRPQHGLGRIGDHVLDLAEAERIDLIVLGTHHRRGLARLGSVAGVTLHYSHSSVAVVPVPSGEILAPDEVPSIRRVLLATDLSPLSNFAVPFGYTLLREGGGEMYLFHVLADAKESTREADITARLRSLVPKAGIPANVTTRTEVVQHANAAHAICQAAERLGVDAICLGSHGRTGFRRALLGSVAEAVMRESHRPMFIVRPSPP